MSTRVFPEFLGYLSQFASESETEFEFAEESALTLSRLNVFIAAAVACLRSDKTGKAGDHRQKFYHDTFASFFSKALDQIVCTI